ncbi:MAG: family 16 glycosylhydrolase [Acholeplasmataceae bacterium]
MKKLLILILILFIAVGCKPTEDPILEPLVPYEGCEESTLEGGWVCTWADEFDGEEVDETKWNYEVNGYGGGNNELQYYTKENASIVDGKLVITAIKESYLGKDYTSSRLNSKYKGDFTYGRLIVSAKLPSGVGTWPAIWMMPTMSLYGGWPKSGEIDIMEYVGRDPNNVFSTIHTEKFNHQLGTQIGYNTTVSNAETEFHTYEMIWNPGEIMTYVDGELLGTFKYSAAFNQEVAYNAAFPFDQDFYLILNLAMGGNLGGAVDPNFTETTFEIDYVRVYKYDYATIDEETPSNIEKLQIAQLRNTVFWNPSTDDYGVEKYAIYVDGELYDYANLNQYTFSRLTAGKSYQIQVQAIDFVGNVSEMSSILSLTIV